MVEGKAMVKETDMSTKMQIHAMASASQALDLYDVYDCISIAAHIKKVPHFFLSLIWGVGLKQHGENNCTNLIAYGSLDSL